MRRRCERGAIMSKLLIHGGRVIDPSQGLDGDFDLLIEDGAVAKIDGSDDGKPVMNAELMRRALLYAQHCGVAVIQHAEDLTLTGAGVMHEGEWSTKLGLPGIPGAAEDVMVARDIILAEDTAGRYHV